VPFLPYWGAVFLAKGIVLKHSLSRIQGWLHASKRRQLQFLVARLVNPVTRSFGDFRPQKPALHPANLQENCKQIWVKNKWCAICFACGAFGSWMKLCHKWSILAIFLWSSCWICSVSNNVAKVYCVYQLCLLAFAKFTLSAAWASPCHGVTISRFKIVFELFLSFFEIIKVQVNGFHLPGLGLLMGKI